MKIVYHHTKSDTYDWWTCPPELICSKKAEEKLVKLWHFFNGKDAYIVDPLGHTQCLYVMLKQIPFSRLIRLFIKKEHIYERES
jgi:hypothetical protein